MDCKGTVAGALDPPGEGCTMNALSLRAAPSGRARPLHDHGGRATVRRTLRAGPRRVVPAARILLGIGAVLARAQDGKKDKPGDRGKPPAAKPGEKMFKFEAAGEPWPRVFEWLAKENGKPVFTPLKVPGTYNVQVPKDASYSLPDTIDPVTEALIQHTEILRQSRKSFPLVAP